MKEIDTMPQDQSRLREALADDPIALEFLEHPQRFEPTDHTVLQLYRQAYELFDDWLAINLDARMAMAKERYRVGHIRDVKIDIVFGYASSIGCDAPILRMSAECLVKNNFTETRRRFYDSGIAFATKEFIQRKRSEPVSTYERQDRVN